MDVWFYTGRLEEKHLRSENIERNCQSTVCFCTPCSGKAPSITVLEQEVSTVEEFVYLGALIHSSTHSSPDILRRSAFTCSAMQSLDKQLWRSRISLSTKLRLYNTCKLPIFLYGSECWAISKEDARRINALNQWCLYASRHQVVSLHLQG